MLQLDGKSCAAGCGQNQGSSSGICTCVTGYVASLDASTCVKTARCEELGGVNKGGRCVCSEEHIMDLTHQRCVAIDLKSCGRNAELKDGQCVCSADYVISLTGLSCLRESVCTDRGGIVQDGRCVCKEGYAANLAGNQCVNSCGTGAEIPDPSKFGQTCTCK